MNDRRPARVRKRKPPTKALGGGTRNPNYRQLKNPFPVMNAFSDGRIEAIHQAALETLEDIGTKVLLPEARAIYKSGGAWVD